MLPPEFLLALWIALAPLSTLGTIRDELRALGIQPETRVIHLTRGQIDALIRRGGEEQAA
jgi:hypothetical protein